MAVIRDQKRPVSGTLLALAAGILVSPLHGCSQGHTGISAQREGSATFYRDHYESNQKNGSYVQLGGSDAAITKFRSMQGNTKTRYLELIAQRPHTFVSGGDGMSYDWREIHRSCVENGDCIDLRKVLKYRESVCRPYGQEMAGLAGTTERLLQEAERTHRSTSGYADGASAETLPVWRKDSGSGDGGGGERGDSDPQDTGARKPTTPSC